MDFLTANQACINYALKPPMFTLFDGLIELPFYTCCDENNCVTLVCTVCIPVYHEAYVQVEMPQRFNNQEVLLERVSVSVARALAFCKNNKTVCRVLNTNPYFVTLKKNLKLAKIAGLTDSVASMREIHQLPVSSSSGNVNKCVMTSLQRPRPQRESLINPAFKSPAEAVLIRSPTWAWLVKSPTGAWSEISIKLT